MLGARGAQTGEAVLVDRILPEDEFLDSQSIAGTGFLEGQQTAADDCDDLGLAPDDPSFGVTGWQVGNRQRAAIWPDHVPHTPPEILLGHDTLNTLIDHGQNILYCP